MAWYGSKCYTLGQKFNCTTWKLSISLLLDNLTVTSTQCAPLKRHLLTFIFVQRQNGQILKMHDVKTTVALFPESLI